MEISIPHAQSLKDKRSVVKGLKDRLRERHNVSVAEIDGEHTWQRATIALLRRRSPSGSPTPPWIKFWAALPSFRKSSPC